MQLVIGFPSSVQGYRDTSLKLEALLIKNPSATVFMTVNTNRYNHLCIFNGDILVIDRAKTVHKNSLVIYESEGCLVIGYVYNIKTEAQITGCITSVIHMVKEK